VKPFIELTLANPFRIPGSPKTEPQIFQTIYVNSAKIISIESRKTFTKVRLSETIIEEVKETPQEIITKILNN